jgi:predicted Zn-dependent peptidase
MNINNLNKNGGTMKFHQFSLPNGMEVLLIHSPTSKIGAIALGSRIGSRYENTHNNGLLHLVEHLVMTESKAFPTTKLQTETLDPMAAKSNADVGKDITIFELKLPSRYLSMGLAMISDLVMNPLFLTRRINNEKNVVIQEIKEALDNFPHVTATLLEKTLFGDHPLAMTELGDKNVVAKITPSQIERFWKRMVKPNNLVLSVVGNFDFNKMKGKIYQLFADFKFRESLPPKLFIDQQDEKRIAIQTAEIECVNFAISFPLPGLHRQTEKGYCTLRVLNNILGGKESSRLYEKLRDSEGLVYSIDTTLSHFSDIGYFTIESSVDPRKFMYALSLIFEELRNLKSKKVSAYELLASQKNLKNVAIMKFSSEIYTAKFYMAQLLRRGKISPLRRHNKDIDAVTRYSVQRQANKIFLTNKTNLAVVGPIDESFRQQINDILVL